jgi:hypothetical protein
VEHRGRFFCVADASALCQFVEELRNAKRCEGKSSFAVYHVVAQQNQIKAGIGENIKEYPWNSYPGGTLDEKFHCREQVLGIFIAWAEW